MAKFGPVLDQIKTFSGSLMLESNHVALRVLASQISKFEDLSVINIFGKCLIGMCYVKICTGYGVSSPKIKNNLNFYLQL